CLSPPPRSSCHRGKDCRPFCCKLSGSGDLDGLGDREGRKDQAQRIGSLARTPNRRPGLPLRGSPARPSSRISKTLRTETERVMNLFGKQDEPSVRKSEAIKQKLAELAAQIEGAEGDLRKVSLEAALSENPDAGY